MKIRDTEVERVSAAMASAQDNAKNQKVGTTKADAFADQARAFLAGMCAVGAFVHNMGDALPDDEPAAATAQSRGPILDTWGKPTPLTGTVGMVGTIGASGEAVSKPVAQPS